MPRWNTLQWTIIAALVALLVLLFAACYATTPLERLPDITALATVGLLIANLWLARSTQVAAEAAKVAADQTLVLERPYLFVGPTNIRPDSTTRNVSVQLVVDNPGRTPGILKKLYGEFSLEAPEGEPVYEGGSGEDVDFVINSSNGLNPLETKIVLPTIFIGPGIKPIYFWGYVEYEDIFKQRHTSQFCARISPVAGKYEAAGGPAWNGFT